MARPTDAERAALGTFARLRLLHPDAHCELAHEGPFQLLVAVVLSAQTTDRNVNLATPALFARFPDARGLAAADVGDVAPLIARLSFYPTKAKHLVALARQIVERHGGEVPRTMGELCALPGVGRKTANVVLNDAFGVAEGVVVDTHVQRLTQRLGWSRASAPEQIERDLVRLFPRSEWGALAHVLIFHGRRVCAARSPACAGCGVAAACPSAGGAERVGRKPPRKARAAGEPEGARVAAAPPKRRAPGPVAAGNNAAARPPPPAPGPVAAGSNAAARPKRPKAAPGAEGLAATRPTPARANAATRPASALVSPQRRRAP